MRSGMLFGGFSACVVDHAARQVVGHAERKQDQEKKMAATTVTMVSLVL